MYCALRDEILHLQEAGQEIRKTDRSSRTPVGLQFANTRLLRINPSDFRTMHPIPV